MSNFKILSTLMFIALGSGQLMAPYALAAASLPGPKVTEAKGGNFPVFEPIKNLPIKPGKPGSTEPPRNQSKPSTAGAATTNVVCPKGAGNMLAPPGASCGEYTADGQ